MPKPDIKAIESLLAEINRKDGKGRAFTLDDKTQALDIPRWSTGLADLDAVIGGGIPEGRILEIYGPESAGKTSLAYHLAARASMTVYFPVEGTLDLKRAKTFGNEKGKFFVCRTDYGEETMNRVISFAKTGIPLIIVDSVPSLVPRSDVEKLEKAVNRNTEEEMRVGGCASMLTKYLPAVEKIAEITGSTILFINQVRDKIGALPFGEQVQTPGGHKLKHSASIRLSVARRDWIDVPNKNPSLTGAKERIGIIMKVRCVKSKVCNPMGECELPMLFERGFVSFSELPELRKRIMKENLKKYGKKEEPEDWEEEGGDE